jgi:hypothetical protein
LALFDLAEVLEAAGRRDEAVVALREAIDCYERSRSSRLPAAPGIDARRPPTQV